jgi:hypothetical protein
VTRTTLKRKTRLEAKGATRECVRPGCSTTFFSYPSKNQRYCSRACWYADHPPLSLAQRAAQSATTRGTRLGAANPNHRHGRRAGDHLRGWNPAGKGEDCCRVCGDPHWLNLHHIVPRSMCPPPAKRDLRNGIVLCASCHQKWHRGALVIARDLFTAVEWTYVSSLRLTGREISAWLDKHYPAVAREAAA